MLTQRLLSIAPLLLGLTAATLRAEDPVNYFYAGDLTPSEGAYAPLFTTLGPGHPTGGFFGGTTWSSNGSVLTMTTQHPNDFPGATSQGIWFGIGYGYGDDPGINFADAVHGNNVTARLALAPASSEWSLYWFDANGYEAALYLETGGFSYYTSAGTTFVPVSDMTAFHTYSTQLFQGNVTYFLDGSLLAQSTAIATGFPNFLLLGDGSASTVTGYGSLLVDSLSITVNAGAPIPESATSAAWLAGAALAGTVMLRRRRIGFSPAE